MAQDFSELVERMMATQVESRRLVDRVRSRAEHALVLTLPANTAAPRSVRQALISLTKRAGASASEIETINTAVSEAVNNTVLHAYEPDGPGDVTVEAFLRGGILTVLVADNGRGPRQASPNPGLGLGWKLIAQLTDRWTIISRGNGGTMILMCFCLLERGLVGGAGARI